MLYSARRRALVSTSPSIAERNAAATSFSVPAAVVVTAPLFHGGGG